MGDVRASQYDRGVPLIIMMEQISLCMEGFLTIDANLYGGEIPS